jgi:hypothetical protein
MEGSSRGLTHENPQDQDGRYHGRDSDQTEEYFLRGNC